MPQTKDSSVPIALVREAIANYMASEGCGCCSDQDAHERHEARLAELLHVPKDSDGSGYNFHKFRKQGDTK